MNEAAFQTFLWTITALSLVGTGLNVKKRISCFYVWTVVNAAWIGVDVYQHLWARMVLDLVHLAFAVLISRMIAEYRVCSGVLPAPGVQRPRSLARSIIRRQLSGSSLSARTAAAAERRESLRTFASFGSAGFAASASALGAVAGLASAGFDFGLRAAFAEAAGFAAGRVFLFVVVVFFLLMAYVLSLVVSTPHMMP